MIIIIFLINTFTLFISIVGLARSEVCSKLLFRILFSLSIVPFFTIVIYFYKTPELMILNLFVSSLLIAYVWVPAIGNYLAYPIYSMFWPNESYQEPSVKFSSVILKRNMGKTQEAIEELIIILEENPQNINAILLMCDFLVFDYANSSYTVETYINNISNKVDRKFAQNQIALMYKHKTSNNSIRYLPIDNIFKK